MTEQLRNRANDILSAVLELPETERKAYVDQACSNDAALHAMVLGLLSKLDQLDDYMEHTAPFVSQLGRPAFVAPQPGERIGNWLVVRELGRGGMGVILLVERDDGSVRQIRYSAHAFSQRAADSRQSEPSGHSPSDRRRQHP